MAKIIDIIVTGIDTNTKNPYQNKLIVRYKKGKNLYNFISGYEGFSYIDDKYTPEHVEQCIDDAGSISLMRGENLAYQVYEMDDDYVVILKNQYLCLKTEGPTGDVKTVGAYCAGIHAYDDDDAYRSYPDVTKFELAEAISDNFAKSYSELKAKIKSDKKNNSKNSNDDEIENE